MKLTPYSKLLTLSKEGKEQSLAPSRAAEMKQKALHEVSKLDVAIAEKESAIKEAVSVYPLDFDRVIKAQDDLALSERRKRQLNELVAELFPK